VSKVDQLIGELASAGEVHSEGGFSIDREKAREKMRQFQLADPRRYVLLLVQSAVHQGATKLDFEIDADDMRLTFDGRPFVREDLEELYTGPSSGRGRIWPSR
jgi:hypothetical protein